MVSSAYGYGPGFGALPDARQGDFINMMLDIAAEKIVRPSMVAPQELEGQLYLTAGGVTYAPAGMPSNAIYPIPQSGDYSVGQERVKMRKDVVNSWFHVELFNMFATLDSDRRQMTAFEINQRVSQKVELIEPAYSRISNEKHTPMLRRLFSLMLDANMLPQPPEEALIQVSEFMAVTPPPSVSYSSRLALAIRRRHNLAFEEALSLDMQIYAAGDQSALDDYNMPRIRRDRARNLGLPPEWMRSEEEVAQVQQQRAEAQQAQAQMMMLEQGSKVAANVAKAGPEMQKMMQ
jgi:hypothetical protein